ncbi:MAG TPA: signal peptide peptidase SppA, partial [Steroidobacteraceae bacterium]|nr:signal peptide peptidase SppA [Steroidobacteraceae bacterium]
MSMLARVFGMLWRVLDGLRRFLHLLLLLAIFIVVLVAVRQPLPLVPSKAALIVHPEGRLVEQLSGGPWERSIGALTADHEPETLVRDVVDAIRAAASDDRIKVLVLDTEDLAGGGLTKLQAIAAAIQVFRASGKKVLAFSRYATQEQYYLMAQADEAYIDPQGAVGVLGYAAYHLYFHDALDKLGVDVHVFKVGTHKSFPEPFTRQDMSPEDREQTVAWLTPLWHSYAEGVEKARHLPAGSVAAYVRDAVPGLREVGGDAALLAQQRGLVTGRKTRLEFDKQLIGLVGEDSASHSFNAIGHAEYLAAARPESALSRHPDGQVAVVVASGSIVDGEAPAGEIGGDSLAEVLHKVRVDPDVKAVVLRIDSGGGSMLASEVIRQEVEAIKAAGKPVVASFSSVAASGGYYIAMDADEIWAEPTTITGSIGVFGIIPTFQKTLGKLGVAADGVETSPLAGAMHLERSLDPSVSEALQLGVEHAYREFVDHVARTRVRQPAEIEKIAEGRVWIGSEARELGLIDRLGDLDKAVESAAKRAKLRPGKYATSFREKELSWRESLVRQLRTQGLAIGRV